MQYDAGLCYKYCSESYYGVGPVCWRSCSGSTPVDCDAACGSSSGACVKNIFNMVKSVLKMIADIVKLITTAGGSAVIKSSTEAAFQNAFQTAKNFISKNYSKASYVNFMMKKAQSIGKTINQQTLEVIYDRASIKDLIKLELEIISKTDPTGIADVILAFMQDLC